MTLRNSLSRMRRFSNKTRLMATAAVLVFPTVAYAQTAVSGFDIPAQSVASALVRYSSITGTNIIYDGTLPAGARSQRVAGELSEQQRCNSFWPARVCASASAPMTP